MVMNIWPSSCNQLFIYIFSLCFSVKVFILCKCNAHIIWVPGSLTVFCKKSSA
ncbi:unnamed protein product [Moneuplotes crassus]|uniref:Uncharacterized protein n=1 Tax=Euplotes crassus TaxID=5936 RepID=A0AAD1XLG8_EUPCR|nr:unnamed protein product [Moneuplotes crassus]